MTDSSVLYKVYIKVPFNRGDFVDPPDPSWTSTKDKELWRILSSTSKGKIIDWHGLADKFDVTLPFLLQQAAWLYERQLSQVREQLRRVNKPLSANASPSPPPTSDSITGSTAGVPAAQSMKRGPSVGQSSLGKPPSNLTLRTKRSDDAGQGSPTASPVQERPQRVPYSRTASANTITQIQKSSLSPVAASSPKSPTIGQDSITRRPQLQNRQDISPISDSPKASPSPSEGSSSEDDAPPLGQSRAFQRRPRFSTIMTKGKGKAPMGGRGLDSVADAAEDSEDSDSGFLPFAAAPATQRSGAKSGVPKSATANTSRPAGQIERTSNAPSQTGVPAKTQPQRTPRPSYDSPPRRTATKAALDSDPASPVSASASASAASHSSQGISVSASHPSLPPNDHRAALAALSPRQRRSVARDGSDTGTPSMGSSFSDLDDASVSMSAMEEALAQQMRGGNGGGGGGGMGNAAASALRGSLAVGMNMGGLWKGRSGGAGGGNGQGRGQGR